MPGCRVLSVPCEGRLPLVLSSTRQIEISGFLWAQKNFLRRVFRGWNLFLSLPCVLLCSRVARGAGGVLQVRTAQSVRGASTCVISTTHARGNHAGSKTSSCRPLMSLLRALATWWRRCGMDLWCGTGIITEGAPSTCKSWRQLHVMYQASELDN